MIINEIEFNKKFPNTEYYLNEALANYTFTKTGGPADMVVFPKTAEEIQAILSYCREQGIPWTVLGNASNLIVRDGGMDGVVILLDRFNQVTIEGACVSAQAGAKLIEVARLAGAHQLTGMEFACGIPGSIGGAVYMNAGAYGGEIKDVFDYAVVLLEDGEIVKYSNKQMDFSYRHSVLQHEKTIVLTAVFQLQEGNQEAIDERMAELTHLRESKQPLEFPSCGSVFKRPEGYFTGQLIQEAGLQGLKWGGAQISTKHAGFIVNVDHATATDYIELIEHIQKVILEKFSVQLETEVRIIGREN